MRMPFDGSYPVTQKFWQENAALTGGFHKGVDLACPALTPIVAITAGTVAAVGFNYQAGNYVLISSGQMIHKYYHLTEAIVQKGQFVGEGQKIGISGSTGIATGPHLHLEVTIGGNLVDPLSAINNQGVTPANPQSPSANSAEYEIKKGDTFWGLEESWGIQHGTLQKLNPQIDPKLLQIGQKIKTKEVTPENKTIAEEHYVIKEGDTFWGLEEAWSIEHGTLQRLNPGIDPKLLQIGQKIRKS